MVSFGECSAHVLFCFFKDKAHASTVASQSPETYIRCTLQYWLQKDGICNKISITSAQGVIRNHSKKAPQMSCVDWPLEGHALEINVVYH